MVLRRQSTEQKRRSSFSLPAGQSAASPARRRYSLSGSVWAQIQEDGAPVAVDLYKYHNRPVFYVTMDCCDNFNYVYDAATGQKLGAPSGGISGHGDNKLPDWHRHAERIRRVWTKARDERQLVR